MGNKGFSRNMEATVQIPTMQFGYVGLKGEVASTKEAIDLHDELLEKVESRKAVDFWAPLKEDAFNKLVDKYLITGTMEAEEYETLAFPIQKAVLQTIKRSYKRIKNNG